MHWHRLTLSGLYSLRINKGNAWRFRFSVTLRDDSALSVLLSDPEAAAFSRWEHARSLCLTSLCYSHTTCSITSRGRFLWLFGGLNEKRLYAQSSGLTLRERDRERDRQRGGEERKHPLPFPSLVFLSSAQPAVSLSLSTDSIIKPLMPDIITVWSILQNFRDFTVTILIYMDTNGLVLFKSEIQFNRTESNVFNMTELT